MLIDRHLSFQQFTTDQIDITTMQEDCSVISPLSYGNAHGIPDSLGFDSTTCSAEGEVVTDEPRAGTPTGLSSPAGGEGNGDGTVSGVRVSSRVPVAEEAAAADGIVALLATTDGQRGGYLQRNAIHLFLRCQLPSWFDLPGDRAPHSQPASICAVE